MTTLCDIASPECSDFTKYPGVDRSKAGSILFTVIMHQAKVQNLFEEAILSESP